MTIFDVAIVGAGPAGSSLAIRLASAGQRVLLLEKRAFPRDKACGDLVSAKGLTELDELGCLETIREREYLEIRNARSALDGEWITQARIPYRQDMVDHAHAIPRAELDEIIFRRAQQVGAETLERCAVGDIGRDNGHVRLESEVEGKPRTFRARMIVGADGAHSIVARRSGLAMTDSRYIEYALRAYCHGLPLNESLLWFEEDFFPGFGWVFPISEGLSNIGVGLVADSAKRFDLDLHAFFQRLVHRVESWAAEQGWECRIDRPIGWPIKTYGGARENYFDRGLLIGEAGCFVDPLSGEGIPPGLESAKLAAETIFEAFEQGEFDAPALRDYETRWRAHFDPDLKIADLIVSMIRNRHLLRIWIDSLRLVCKTAENDPDYARQVGGVLAGIVPIRDSFTPEVLWRSLNHGPRFWLDFFDISRTQPLPGLWRTGLDYGFWQLSTWGNLTRDPEWLLGWFREVSRKQRLVMSNRMNRRGRVGSTG